MLVLSISIALKNFMAGKRLDESAVEERRNKCNSCELKSKFIVDYCDKCKCVIALKTKAIEERCPIGQW